MAEKNTGCCQQPWLKPASGSPCPQLCLWEQLRGYRVLRLSELTLELDDMGTSQLPIVAVLYSFRKMA